MVGWVGGGRGGVCGEHESMLNKHVEYMVLCWAERIHTKTVIQRKGHRNGGKRLSKASYSLVELQRGFCIGVCFDTQLLFGAGTIRLINVNLERRLLAPVQFLSVAF